MRAMEPGGLFGKRIRFEEHLAECERRGRFGVVTAILLAHGETLRRFDLDQRVAIANCENVGPQCREPEDTNYLHTIVAAQVRKI